MGMGSRANRLAVGLAALVVVAGCGATTTPSPVPPVTMPPPTASPVAVATPTSAPTPTPTPWSQGTAAAVTGTINCGTVVKAGAEGSSPPPYTLIGRDLLCAAAASDPRVTGTGSFSLNIEGWDPALPTLGNNGVAWGYQEIQGPDGTWAGRTYGIYDKDGILHNFGVMAGSGAYDGLIYAVAGTVPASSSTADTVGVIQSGAPPPGYMVTPFPVPSPSSPTESPSAQAAWAAVTGTMDCNDLVKAGSESSSPPPYTLTGQILACPATASDPRVIGTGNASLNIEGWDARLDHNSVAWVYQEIKGPDGTWAGRSYAIYDKDGIVRGFGIFAGSGAYEGLIYALSTTIPAGTAALDTIGVIQSGAPPPGFPVTPFPAP
jgi:hypothetical protein